MSKKNDSGIVYNSIYYPLQWKNEKWLKNKYIIVYNILYSEKLIEKWVRKMTQE